MFVINTENLKKLKYHIFLQKMYDFFPLLTESVVMSIKKDI